MIEQMIKASESANLLKMARLIRKYYPNSTVPTHYALKCERIVKNVVRGKRKFTKSEYAAFKWYFDQFMAVYLRQIYGKYHSQYECKKPPKYISSTI